MIRFADDGPAGAEVDLPKQVEAIFSPDGLLSRAKPFEYRAEQQAMAVAVARALEEQAHLAVEAGTGVGKSMGYLVPAILHAVKQKRKAVVSTHTINLQEQLIYKDLPLLAKILPVRFQYAMLKGRHNYLCTRRLERALQQSAGLFTTPESEELRRIQKWAETTEDGTLSDFEAEPDPKVWQQVCSERGLCTAKLCGYSSDFAKGNPVCFFQRARRRYLEADVLVLNHTLFFTLLGMDEGEEDADERGILFRNDFVIFDEAHTLEAVASKHIGVGVADSQLRFSLQRLWNPQTQKGLFGFIRKQSALPLVEELLQASQEFFSRIEERCHELARAQRAAPGEAAAARSWSEVRVRQPDLVHDTLTAPLQRLRETVSEAVRASDNKDLGEELMECNRRLMELREGIAVFLSQNLEEFVYWVERSGRQKQNIALHAAPINVAEFLRQRLFRRGASVLMASATLGTKRAGPPPETAASGLPERSPPPPSPAPHPLHYFARRVGAESARLVQLGSPFDYPRQLRLVLVRKIPDPRQPGYEESLASWIEFFVRKTHGKALVLFTNARLMREMGARLAPLFQSLGFETLVQGGGMPRSLLLEKFKENIDSVLFGADSFWQGVDVPGEALSNVIITRLPFAVPDHPLIAARVEKIEASGGNSFRDFSLPEAILKFRQGVGRLIRTKSDHGIVVVLDNRVLTKQYGRAFLDAMPPCPVEIV